MYNYLREQTNASGDHMRPQSNNSRFNIQSNFNRSQRFNALKGFYDQHPIKYWDARLDFYRNNNIIKLWRP